MYNKDMKSLIKYAIELDIFNIKTFTGYNGGDILSLKTRNKQTTIQIKNYCHKLLITTNIKDKNNEYEVFCEFGKDRYSTNYLDSGINEGIYYLK
jgi:hypothetical protein